MMTKANEIARTLRTVYGDLGSTPAFAHLLRYAQTPSEDETAQLSAFGLDILVSNVLIDGMTLADAGKAASFGRYDTENQARAFAIAQILTAGKVLVWNAKVFAPHRRMSAALAERYRMLKAMRAVAARQEMAA